MKLKIKKLNPEATLPRYVHPGDVGMDLFSLDTYTIQPGEQHFFFLGFALEFEHGYAAIIKDRSSMAKKGLHTMGGVFDSGFRGEYNVLLVNLGKEPYTIQKGDKIAQLIIYPIIIAELEESDELSTSARGLGRFGSTGR